MTSPQPVEAWLSALHLSHDHLVEVASPLTPEEVDAPSYASEWSIAQVLSHLGSGAEIFGLFIGAGLGEGEAPGMDAFQPVWERWNAKAPEDQVTDALKADARLLSEFDSLDAAERSAWQLEMFGGTRHLDDVLRMRLGEHALHTWDVAVARDPGATVLAAAIELLVDQVGELVARVGKPSATPLRVHINTYEPARSFILAVDTDGANLAASGASAEGDATLELPAEALVRLVYGRLDADHAPAVSADGIDIGVLRDVFPGF